MNDTSITVCFDDQAIEIGYNNIASQTLVNFLFKDLPMADAGQPKTRFDVIAAGKLPMLSLWEGDKRFYFGQSQYRLAYTLINEIIYHCIAENKNRHAIHAGAIHHKTKGIILPGKSGSGKSTLTAWFITHGFEYLTDELVFLSQDGQITPFTRPISLKGDQISIFKEIDKTKLHQVISDKRGAMIPHRLFNPNFSPRKPLLTHIIFPEFQKNAPTSLTEISPAKSCMMLMESHVNARNFSGLGITELSRIVRNCLSFKLISSNLEGLNKILPEFLSN